MTTYADTQLAVLDYLKIPQACLVRVYSVRKGNRSRWATGDSKWVSDTTVKAFVADGLIEIINGDKGGKYAVITPKGRELIK